jgi:hypothetical protein
LPIKFPCTCIEACIRNLHSHHITMISARQRLSQPTLYRFCLGSIVNACEKHVGTPWNAATNGHLTNKRSMASKSPGSDPLDVLRKECAARNRCDAEGFRLGSTLHWTFSFSIGSPDPKIVSKARHQHKHRFLSDSLITSVVYYFSSALLIVRLGT